MFIFDILALFTSVISFFLPIILVIFLIKWISSKVESKTLKNMKSDYEVGYENGYSAAVERVRKETKDEKLVRKLLAAVNQPDTKYVAAVAGAEEIPREEVVKEDYADQYTSLKSVDPPKPRDPEADAKKALNILMGLSSLLFIAAGVAFIASEFSKQSKLFVLVLIVTLFYIGGLWLYSHKERLRPAAVSFVGTGLALIPFLGVALTQYTEMRPVDAWMITSIFGVAAYVFAAIKLQSQVISYLAIAFALSLASSAVASASLPIMWYFMVMILISLVAGMVSYARPSWLPNIFLQPIESTGQVVTPIALMASLFMIDSMRYLEYEMLFGLAAVQYIVSWLQTKRSIYENLSRILIHVTGIIFALSVSDTMSDRPLFGSVFLVLATAQLGYSLVRWQSTKVRSEQNLWIPMSLCLIWISSLFWVDADTLGAATYTAVSYGTLMGGALGSAYLTRQCAYGYVALFASTVLMFVIGRWAAMPLWSFGFISLMFMLFAGLLLGIYWRRLQAKSLNLRILTIFSIATYGLVGLFTSFMETTTWAGASLLLVAMALVYAASYIFKNKYFIIAAGVLICLATGRLLINDYQSDNSMAIMFTFMISAVAMYALSSIHSMQRDRMRSGIMLLAGHIYMIPAIMAIPSAGLWGGNEESGRIMSLVIAVAWSIGLWAWARHDPKFPTRQMAHCVFYVIFYLLALGVAIFLPYGWPVTILSLGVGMLWEASYQYRRPHLVLTANILAVLALYILLSNTAYFEDYTNFIIAILSTAIFCLLYWMFDNIDDPYRRQSMFVSTIVAAILGFLGYYSSDFGAAAAMLLVYGAVIIAWEGKRRNNMNVIETGIYTIVFGLSAAIGKLEPELNLAFYAHIWAATLSAMAYVRQNDKTRYMLGVGILTAIVGIYALNKGGEYSLIFLSEQVVLTVLGYIYRKRWAVWWGIIGSVCAIFYYLRESPFLIFSLLGTLIAIFVIWRLNYKHDK